MIFPLGKRSKRPLDSGGASSSLAGGGRAGGALSREEEQGPRSWLALAIMAAGAVGGAWLALAPLPANMPEPRPRPLEDLLPVGVVPAPFPAPEDAPEASGPDTAAPPGAEVPAPPEVETESVRPPPPFTAEGIAPDPKLGETIERQLAMNDLPGIRVDVVGERVVASGALPSARDRDRVALIVRALAPGRRYEDHTTLASRPAPP